MESQTLFQDITTNFPAGSDPYWSLGEPKEKTENFLKNWKIKLNTCTPKEKKENLLYTIEKVEMDSTLTVKQVTICYRILQDLTLSPKVCNLAEKKIFIRRYDSYYPRPSLGEPFKEYLVKQHQVKLRFATSIDEFPESTVFKVNMATWVLFKHGIELHMTLLRVTKTIDSIKMEIFDSLGVRPDSESNNGKPYRSNLRKIKIKLQKSKLLVEVFGDTRQRQIDSVTCAHFVEADYITARDLIKNKKPLFQSEKEANPEFFNISQMKEHIEKKMSDPKFIRSYTTDFSSRYSHGNAKPMLMALSYLKTLIKDELKFVDADFDPGRESEKDVKDCIIS